MNSLGYGLLSLLSREPKSGYDLMLRIQPFWQAKHSQIYPLLSKMETEGYVEHERVLQSDKPDKKVYSITAAGLQKLKNWLPEPTTEVATRDELLIKMYAIWLSDTATAKQLMEERIAASSKRLQRHISLREELQASHSDDADDVDILSPDFARYLLIRRQIDVLQSEIDWCHWVLKWVTQKA